METIRHRVCGSRSVSSQVRPWFRSDEERFERAREASSAVDWFIIIDSAAHFRSDKKMIRFLQTEGPVKKIVLSGLLLLICAAMVIAFVPGIGTDSTGTPGKGVIAKVNGAGYYRRAGSRYGAPDGATAGAAIWRAGVDDNAFSDAAGDSACVRAVDRQGSIADRGPAHGVEIYAAGSEG